MKKQSASGEIPVDQHFVPQMYLRNFAFIYNKSKNGEDRLYAFNRDRINNNIPNHFDSYTPAMICYKKDFYKFQNNYILKDFSIDDAYEVEKTAFKKYEENYNKILSKILSKLPNEKTFITITEATLFIKTLLNMKKRNPYYVFQVNKQNTVKEVHESFKKDLLENRELIEAQLATEGNTFETLMQEIENRTEDKEFANDLLRLSLLKEGIEDADQTLSQISDILLNCTWHIYETTIDNKFITSDNPGFCLDNNKELMNLFFVKDFEFCFPLSPYAYLIIERKNEDFVQPPFKEIYLRVSSVDFVTFLNRCTLANVYQYIYSNSQEAIFRTITDYKVWLESSR